ncbi:MAG: hypothetical protein QF441_05565 [Bacteriovoracaceae bacterium]|jgi:hypothetical protein|nr:hypothetical protein [Halobacteriovoraceae bacterium]MDP7320054.1 hypothetical protein [Bacteriovoracaceae bacterium]|tara:strand:- start:159 stop:692 length:534 start_codon:yes stop_codon:yes gene_type:complete
MGVKLRSKAYLNLWRKGAEDCPHLKLASGQYDNYCKKAIDHLCMKADMCESLESYIETICSGMIDLLKTGVPKNKILKHPLALSKILQLGEDIIEYSEKKSDLFYIGLFVEMKIASNWSHIPFYRLILNMLKKIIDKVSQLPRVLRHKIEQLVKEKNYPLYALYFVKDKSPSFKNSA